MGKKPATKRSKAESKPEPPAESTADPFIEPFLLKISALLRSEKLTSEEMAKPLKWTWSSSVPKELVPFLEWPSLDNLVPLVKAHPWLYWHPLVYRQISYLRRLRYDEDEWQRLGWEPKWDDTYGIPRPPKEVSVVLDVLRNLVEAHAGSLFPRSRIVWKPEHGKRTSRLKNPHPTGEPWTQWVEAAWLDEDFRHLRATFKARLKESEGKPALRADAKEWHRKLAEEVLEETSASAGVGWWSGCKDYKHVEHTATPSPDNRPCHAGPDPPRRPQDRDLWLKTSVGPYALHTYDAATGTWKPTMKVAAQDVRQALELVNSLRQPITWDYVECWKPLNLDDALDKMLRREPVSLTREGKPAYLGYAVLGALLGKEPDKLREFLDNYRYRRRRKKSK